MSEVCGSGRIPFRKLVVDGVSPYDQFCSQLAKDGNLAKQLSGAINIMNQVANFQRLPSEKFREITPHGEQIKEYEIKKGDLRFYVIKEDGHILVFAGKKGSQKKDIRRFRLLKESYLQSKP